MLVHKSKFIISLDEDVAVGGPSKPKSYKWDLEDGHPCKDSHEQAHEMTDKAMNATKGAGGDISHIAAHTAHKAASLAHREAMKSAFSKGMGKLGVHHKNFAGFHNGKAEKHKKAVSTKVEAIESLIIKELTSNRLKAIVEKIEACCDGCADKAAEDVPMPNKPLLKEKSKSKFLKSAKSLKTNTIKVKIESAASNQGSNQEKNMERSKLEEMKRLAGEVAGKPSTGKPGEKLGGTGGQVGANDTSAPSNSMRDIGGSPSKKVESASPQYTAPITKKVPLAGAELGDDTTTGGEVGDEDESAASKKTRDIGGATGGTENGEEFAAKASADQGGSKYKPVDAPGGSAPGADLGSDTTTGGEVGDRKSAPSKDMRTAAPDETPAGAKKPKMHEAKELVKDLRRLMGYFDRK